MRLNLRTSGAAATTNIRRLLRRPANGTRSNLANGYPRCSGKAPLRWHITCLKWLERWARYKSGVRDDARRTQRGKETKSVWRNGRITPDLKELYRAQAFVFFVDFDGDGNTIRTEDIKLYQCPMKDFYSCTFFSIARDVDNGSTWVFRFFHTHMHVHTHTPSVSTAYLLNALGI